MFVCLFTDPLMSAMEEDSMEVADPEETKLERDLKGESSPMTKDGLQSEKKEEGVTDKQIDLDEIEPIKFGASQTFDEVLDDVSFEVEY